MEGAHAQQAGFPDQAVLHMQQVLGGQLREPEQAPQADVAELAGPLRVQVPPRHRARAALQRIQVALALLKSVCSRH